MGCGASKRGDGGAGEPLPSGEKAPEEDLLELSLHDKPKKEAAPAEEMPKVAEEDAGGREESAPPPAEEEEAPKEQEKEREGIDESVSKDEPASADEREGGNEEPSAENAEQPSEEARKSDDAAEAASAKDADEKAESAPEDAPEGAPEGAPQNSNTEQPEEASDAEKDAVENKADPVEANDAEKDAAENTADPEANDAEKDAAENKADAEEANDAEKGAAESKTDPEEANDAEKETTKNSTDPEEARGPEKESAAENTDGEADNHKDHESRMDDGNASDFPNKRQKTSPEGPSLPTLLKKMATEFGGKACFHHKVNKEWADITWEAYATSVGSVGKALLEMGVHRGDRIAIMSMNRPEWAVIALGAMSIGAIPTGIYTHCQPTELFGLIENSKPSMVFVDAEPRYSALKPHKDAIQQAHDQSITVVALQNSDIEDDQVMTWETFVSHGAKVSQDEWAAKVNAIDANDTAILSYSSGVQGKAKGVLLSHQNLISAAKNFQSQAMEMTEADTYLSYLPLAHVAEVLFCIVVPILSGMQVYFAEAVEKLPENLKDVQPSFVSGVPRVWDKIYQNLSRMAAGLIGKGSTLTEFVKKDYAKMMLPSLRSKMGVNKVKMVISSTDALDANLVEFYHAAGIPVCDMYGQTETAGITAVSTPSAYKLGYVGKPMDKLEVKLSEDEEILVKGPFVFQGYFGDREATEKVMDNDGWFSTGDYGEYDDEGYLRVKGNRAEMVLTSDGETIPVRSIEVLLNRSKIVAQSVIYGETKPYLTAVIQPNADHAATLTKDQEGVEPHNSPAVAESIQQAIDQINASLAESHQIQKFVVAKRPFTLDSGELTPTFKLRRQAIFDNYSDEIGTLNA